MEKYQQQFAEFAISVGALKFGDFTLKSGRKSPYFFNSAAFNTGASIDRLGYFYSQAIHSLGGDRPEVIFGPAYKGIPLAVATAIALSREFGWDVGYCFDRKEAKTHGDAGTYVGQKPVAGTRVVLLDDVITDGATKMESIASLRQQTGAAIDHLFILLNRCERNAEGEDPCQLLQSKMGVQVHALLTIRELVEYLGEGEVSGTPLIEPGACLRIRKHLEDFGIQE
jgi:orotate phosphoribosyltransferase